MQRGGGANTTPANVVGSSTDRLNHGRNTLDAKRHVPPNHYRSTLKVELKSPRAEGDSNNLLQNQGYFTQTHADRNSTDKILREKQQFRHVQQERGKRYLIYNQ